MDRGLLDCGYTQNMALERIASNATALSDLAASLPTRR
jgi:hypothetical protein